MTILRRVLYAVALSCGFSGCGVKGDPEPPGTPVQIGRGRPTYKGLGEETQSKSPFGPTESDSEADVDKEKKKGAR